MLGGISLARHLISIATCDFLNVFILRHGDIMISEDGRTSAFLIPAKKQHRSRGHTRNIVIDRDSFDFDNLI